MLTASIKLSEHQNNDLAKNVREEIEKSLKKEMQESRRYDIIDLFGELIAPFTGSGCTAIHSGDECSCDKVLEAVIVYFAKKENIMQLPEDVHCNTLNVLSHLHTFMKKLSEYDNLGFEVANLHLIKKWDSMSNEDKKGFLDWYVGPIN